MGYQNEEGIMNHLTYKITFNWHNEVIDFFRHAKNEERALYYGISALAEEVGYNRKFVSDYILDSKANRWSVIPMVKK